LRSAIGKIFFIERHAGEASYAADEILDGGEPDVGEAIVQHQLSGGREVGGIKRQDLFFIIAKAGFFGQPECLRGFIDLFGREGEWVYFYKYSFLRQCFHPSLGVQFLVGCDDRLPVDVQLAGQLSGTGQPQAFSVSAFADMVDDRVGYLEIDGGGGGVVYGDRLDCHDR